MSITYEINLFSQNQAELTRWLLSHGHLNFVEASYDDLNNSDQVSAEIIEDLLRKKADELPLTFYFDSVNSSESFKQKLETFPGKLRIEEKSYDSLLWQQAWEDREKNFSIDSWDFLVSTASGYQPQSNEIINISGGAFGSGQHATTKALLRLMADLLSDSGKSESLLDVGTGTGVLAIFAKKLGFKNVVATDIDNQAISSAKRNQKLNSVELEIYEGELPPLQAASQDVIVSNILPPVIHHLLPEFVRLLRPEGYIMLAGVTAANASGLKEVAAANGLIQFEERGERHWLALAFKKNF